jgi:hypothetical protein
MEDLGDDCRINYYDKEGRLTNTQLVKRVKGTLKTPARCLVLKILKKENKPLHLEDILLKVWKEGIFITPQTLRLALNNRNEFIYLKDKKFFGLKVWEKNGEIKGGSIRGMVYEYLNQFDEPKHISEIFSFVKKYKLTTLGSIRSSIRQEIKEKSIMFEIHKKHMVGIKGKEYPILEMEKPKIQIPLAG